MRPSDVVSYKVPKICCRMFEVSREEFWAVSSVAASVPNPTTSVVRLGVFCAAAGDAPNAR
jgi:hypothetical protein